MYLVCISGISSPAHVLEFNTTAMPRPAFQLTDTQARGLVERMPAILENYPAGSRDHRSFVRDFLRAVFDATGSTYSPVIYRRLLDVYAPGRQPSTDTLAQEKKALDAALAEEAQAGRQIEEGVGEQLAAVVQRAVEDALTRAQITRADSFPVDQIALAQRDYLQSCLTEAEQTLNQVRAQTAQLAADLQATCAVRDALAAQLEATRAAAAQQNQQVTTLTTELEGMRRFALQAVDGVRGETRAWQERCAQLEAQLKQSKQHLEYFRQIAYQRGAPIPADLRNENKT